MKYIKAEMWDKVQRVFRNYYDGTIHAVFYYDGKIDEEILKNAYMYALNKLPVLHSTYVEGLFEAHWSVNKYYFPADFFELIETSAPESELNSFITQEINPKATMQFKAALIRSEGKDTLAVIVNHMCCDGGDFKYFNNKIAELYNGFVKTGCFNAEIKEGTRSAKQVYYTMSEEKRQKANGLIKNVSSVSNKAGFPFTPFDDTERKRIFLSQIDRGTFLSVKANAKRLNATVNDVFLAAYVQALYSLCKYKPTEKMSVECMVDLRKYANGRETFGITNLTGFMPCLVKRGCENIFDTVEYVSQLTAQNKSDPFMGLHSLPLLDTAYKVLPYRLAQLAIHLGYENPLYGMSNIGVIEGACESMGAVTLLNAWYSGGVKYKPYIQLAMTSCADTVTMSVAVKANLDDELLINRMLGEIKRYVSQFARGDAQANAA